MATVMEEPHVAYFEIKSGYLVRNARGLLARADEPVTPQTIRRFVETLPRGSRDLDNPEWRESYCARCCRKAFDDSREQDDRQRVDELVQYFFEAFVLQPMLIQKMLRECVLGVLDGLDSAI